MKTRLVGSVVRDTDIPDGGMTSMAHHDDSRPQFTGFPGSIAFAQEIVRRARSTRERDRAWATDSAIRMLAEIWAALDDPFLTEAAATLRDLNLLDDFDVHGQIKPARERRQYRTERPA